MGVTEGQTHIPTSQSTPAADPKSNSDSTSNNFEMSDLDESKRQTAAGSQGLNDVSIPTTSPITSDFFSTSTDTAGPAGAENTKPAAAVTAESASAEGSSATKDFASPSADIPASGAESSAEAPPATITRLDSVAIGAAETLPTPVVASEAGPVLIITLLLTSGARHPYKIDEKYLLKRGVNVPETTESGRKDPFSISVYTLKELILREWRTEWEAQPSSPSSIRLIYFGRLLDDKIALKGKYSSQGYYTSLAI